MVFSSSLLAIRACSICDQCAAVVQNMRVTSLTYNKCYFDIGRAERVFSFCARGVHIGFFLIGVVAPLDYNYQQSAEFCQLLSLHRHGRLRQSEWRRREVLGQEAHR
eukprot:5636761-Pyramimonas_sp.AAC.1